MIVPDEGILNRRTWILVGVLFGLLAVAVVTGAMWQAAPQQPAVRAPAAIPTAVAWQLGSTVRVRATMATAVGAGLPAAVGTGCTVQAGAVGRIVEIGGPLASPRAFVEVQFDGCTGWLPAVAVVRP